MLIESADQKRNHSHRIIDMIWWLYISMVKIFKCLMENADDIQFAVIHILVHAGIFHIVLSGSDEVQEYSSVCRQYDLLRMG
jgi:hypothetical protein